MGSYLGQNFLIDNKVRRYIAEHIAKMYDELGCEALIEIGPGKGAITKMIDTISDNFFVIEKDASLAGKLELLNYVDDDLDGVSARASEAVGIASLRSQGQQGRSPILIQGDVLEVDVEKMLKAGCLRPDATLIVGNLPYYITSPILRKFFGNGEQKYAGGIFMLQDEVGQKLRSDAKKKSYLRWLINFAYHVEYLKVVPAKAFKPAPKVKSCLVELVPNYELRITNPKKHLDWNKLIDFLNLFAPFSRKTLGAIEKIVEKQQIDKRFVRKASSGREESSSPTRDKMINFVIPESLKKKRLEELSFEELSEIINNE